MKYLSIITLIVTVPSLSACSTSSEKSETSTVSQVSIVDQSTKSASAKVIDSYTAHISDKDKIDSKGLKLTNAKDIILQDRKNYYDFNLRDKGDTPSKVFASKENRWGEGKPVSEMKWEPVNSRKPEQGYRWNMRQGVEYEIIKGNPDLKIQVYDDGNIHVNPLDKY